MSETETPTPIIRWSAEQQAALLANDADFFKNPNTGKFVAGLTQELWEKLKEENTGFRWVDASEQTPKPLSDEEKLQVRKDRKHCPLCQGDGMLYREAYGPNTGVRILREFEKCWCHSYLAYISVFTNPLNVGVRYHECTMPRLLNGEYRREIRGGETFYRLIVEVLKAYPDSSMLISGPGSSGKTTIQIAVFEQAVRLWATKCRERQSWSTHSVWRVKALRLAEELKEFGSRGVRDKGKDDLEMVKPPRVHGPSIELAKQEDLPLHLSIDEFDKFVRTDFQKNHFHDFVESIHNNRGQVVVTSNMTIEELIEAFNSKQYGEPLMWRLVSGWRDPGQQEPTGGIYIDFFKHAVYISNRKAILDKYGKLVLTEERLKYLAVDRETYQPKKNTKPAGTAPTRAASDPPGLIRNVAGNAEPIQRAHGQVGKGGRYELKHEEKNAP